jgi:hypothetical protein
MRCFLGLQWVFCFNRQIIADKKIDTGAYPLFGSKFILIICKDIDQ